jgi:hypothetical protein
MIRQPSLTWNSWLQSMPFWEIGTALSNTSFTMTGELDAPLVSRLALWSINSRMTRHFSALNGSPSA